MTHVARVRGIVSPCKTGLVLLSRRQRRCSIAVGLLARHHDHFPTLGGEMNREVGQKLGGRRMVGSVILVDEDQAGHWITGQKVD